MKKVITTLGLAGILFTASMQAAFEDDLIFRLNTGTTTDMTGVSPVAGMVVYNETDNQIYYYDGTRWVGLTEGHKGTEGSIFFAGTDSKPTEDNSQLFWDNNNSRLGIGTSTPKYALSIHEVSSSAVWAQFTNSTTGTTANDGFYMGIGNSENAFIWNAEDTPMRFYTNNTERMRITKDGRMGVGTTIPKSKLAVVGLPDGLNAVTALGDNSGSAGLVHITNDGNMYIDDLVVSTDPDNKILVGSDNLAYYSGSVVVVPKTAGYTLQAGDNGKVLTFDSASDVTLRVPLGLPIGYNVSVYQIGAGKVRITGGATVKNRLSRFKTAGKDAGVGIVSTATDVFHLTGDLKK